MYTEVKEVAFLTLFNDIMDRLESIEKEIEELKEAQLDGKEILRVLPQGHGSGLNADKLDGKHLVEILKKADEQTRDFARRLERKIGAVALSYHGNEIHTPNFEPQGLSLLLDGSRAMTGDLDVDVNKLKFGSTSGQFKSVDANYIDVRNAADDDYGSLRLSNFKFASCSILGTLMTFYTHSGCQMRWYVWDTGTAGWKCLMRVVASNPPRIYMENLPVADPHIVGVLWNNGGVVTVSAG